MKEVFKVERSVDGENVKHALAVPMVKVIKLTAAASESFTKSITAAQSGTTFVIDSSATSATMVLSLPTPEIGLFYRFVNGPITAHSNATTIVCTSDGSSSASIGYLLGQAAGAIANELTAAATVAFGDSSTNMSTGDYITCFCDGTNWFFNGEATVGSSITL
jgi:hypothetical protein